MRILLLGASGFIGSAIARALLAGGHELRAAGRDLIHGARALPEVEWVFCDLRRMAGADAWKPLLDGIEAVVNASGALQSGLRDNVAQIQERAIKTLIEAAQASGITRFVQVSAAGANDRVTDFMRTKARADAALEASGMPHTILRPGLVIGRNAFGGTELLRAASGLPLAQFELVGAGRIQCVALTDVVNAARRALEDGVSGSFDLVESRDRSLGEIVTLHRQWLRLAPVRFSISVPVELVRLLSLVADGLGWLGWRSALRSNAVAALIHGVGGDVSQTRKLLGRDPLSLPEALMQMGAAGKADRWHARLAGVYPLALAALVVLWLASGVLGLARQDEAVALLVGGGLSPTLARAAVAAGSAADVAIAAGILFRPALKTALKASVLLATAYCLGATVLRPDLWLDPLGAMLKVIPIIMLTLMCLAMADEH